jgi:hypothetical protein
MLVDHRKTGNLVTRRLAIDRFLGRSAMMRVGILFRLSSESRMGQRQKQR